MKISLQETAAKLLSANKVIITAHVNPDGDALGSSLGLSHILKEMGKSVQVLIDDDVPADFSFLTGITAIEKPELASYDCDLLVVLDASLDRVGSVVDKCQGPILNIDHHRTNDDQGDWLYLDADKAATAEIIYQVATAMKADFSPAAAICLYTGMATDTGYFRYSNTTASTMMAASIMLSCGARAEVVSEALEKRSYRQVLDKAKALQTVELSSEGKVAGLYIDYPLYETLESTEGFIDSIRVIEGVDVAVLLKEVEPGLCRVSMRSYGIDVSVIAASFSGGGHIRAAGCSIQAPLAEAKSQLLAAINKVIQETTATTVEEKA